ncbi:TetR/AcrR family transcriptional regulator [Cellulomonas edaphi]|uniref:Helix-turn-helix domain-containing protein n=1 Tax=Cellulomonas edaphi TaxID=3053468 RepID=A0ABT7S7B3_9CELL|nr:TetR/AcrR family transcriptional regulator [Cellulomons edaphi]MDM7831505.1 helix-turn-helix domain-containing protein [Cellulomons edaphi]
MATVPVRERTRREILDRALELFVERGYHDTSLADIASAVGCSKATLLYHFANKAAIVSEVLEPAALRLDGLVKARLAAPDAPEAQERTLEEFVDLVVQYRSLSVVLDGAEILAEVPSFMAVADSCLSLPGLLAGGTEPERLRIAHFALNGAVAECRDHTHTDDSLRAVLLTCLRRLLL